MEQSINEIELNGVKYIPKHLASDNLKNTEGMPYVLVRTYSAGVHIGYLKEQNGKEVTLLNSRNIWYWSGAAGVSQLATDGVSNPDGCKFTVEVPERILTEAIEILPVTEKAFANLTSVPVWKK